MIRTPKREKEIKMTILLVLNSKSARNVQVLVRLPNEILKKKFRDLMRAKKHKEAFELLYSKSEPEHYLDPNKTHSIKPPEYILVEDLIFACKQKEALKEAPLV